MSEEIKIKLEKLKVQKFGENKPNLANNNLNQWDKTEQGPELKNIQEAMHNGNSVLKEPFKHCVCANGVEKNSNPLEPKPDISTENHLFEKGVMISI